jgi:starvation-inducible DNA-binding protein
MAHIATELDADAVNAVAEGLTQALAEVSVTTMKAQNYHWNVTGMSFGPLHDLFQTIYEDHFKAQDDTAERIRALDVHAVGRYADYLERSKIKECDGHVDARTMIANMQADQETLAGTYNALADLAEEKRDMITNDFAIGRAAAHEKFAWMLRAHLKG